MFGAAASHLGNDPGSEPGPSSYGAGVGSSSGADAFSAQHGSNAMADPWTLEDEARALDLVFIMDATGSMGSYITSATKNIETICDEIIRSEELSSPQALRVGLIAYRDHPPQDHTYVTKNFGFSSKIEEVKKHLKSLYATGGGDGPEAVTAAMKATLDLDWRPRATKLAVLIADAPPHGIGEYGDGFPNGSPEGNDPLLLARQMARVGISLYMVACEPALSGYQYGADFFQALVRLTGGQLLPLTTASLLSHVIIAAAGEAMELERLQREIGDAVADRLRSLSIANAQQQAIANGAAAPPTADEASMDDVARELHERLLLRNESTKQIYIESIYRQSEESAHNIRVWSTAPNIGVAKGYIKKVPGSRLSDAYMATRKASTSYVPTASTYPSSTSAAAASLRAASGSSSRGSTGRTDGGSRRVVSDFSAFKASPGMSIGGPSTSPQMDRVAGFRGGRMESDMMDDDDDDDDMASSGNLPGIARDDDDDDDVASSRPLPAASLRHDGVVEVAGEDGQRVAFQQAPISLEQVRRLAMQSAARGGL
ncbi:hypothetical protein OC846_005649 [Tilletia horrida]|uniref:VWFA domain-containing protein n=1 Tax=Tilletia horrida TaxID=155126 RepID=A0AAN6GK38_9BASI|nr:hypothetical protein OC846_005649 [Tilletia horrida]KAK0562724.1 hypothetical protein OC861_005167 [Tilletia horrida]